MNRRQVLKGAVVGAGTVAAAKPQQALPRATSDAWKPAFFDAHQNETVIALTDLMIPATDTAGAKEAQVNRVIDLVLSESSPEVQRKFTHGLAWLDGYALRTHGAPFVKCSPAQQAALLRSLDPDTHPRRDLHPGMAFFREIKRRAIAGYYTSKVGYHELNKGGRVPASFGCPHAGHGG